MITANNINSNRYVTCSSASATDSPLGAYRDLTRPGLYSDDPIIAEHENKFIGGGHHAFKPDFGPLGAFGTGAIYEGSQKIVVRGRNGKPTSWEFYEWRPTGVYTGDGWPVYGWVRSERPEEDIVQIPFVRQIIDDYQTIKK
ncbi:MAG: hypothetical protein ACD_62C00004G0008 [uncultured bacterium]|nr:MAG: hypothetical protein ACD_62C00004G0008 [uncultured bacterium]HLD45412.1 hypothetical protein [bacterium]